MIGYQLDPITWFSERELHYTPKHFVVTSHPCTSESKQWVLDKLSGRFSVTYATNNSSGSSILELVSPSCLAFEDPQEAVFYELKWS
jgi:hypothetical protein